MKQFFILLIIITSVRTVNAQSSYLVSGKVISSSDGEPILGALVRVKETGKATTSDFSGIYKLSFSPGTYTLEVSFIGFTTNLVTVTVVDKQITRDITLAIKVTELNTVVIENKKEDENVKKVEMSTNELNIDEIKKMPAFMGEPDIIKSIQLLPGVTTVGEGASGFNVRGGNIDQNLMLFDKAPIYSSSHLFGFFSVFNADVVDNVKLYKGGIPARFGGRISSVLDVTEKPGTTKGLKVKGGLGLVSSRVAVEGPLKKGSKSSFIVAGRRSYADLFLKLSPDPSLNQTSAYFYDLNGKFNFKIDQDNQLSVSSYYGKDVFKFSDEFGFNWGNFVNSIIWKHTISDSMFLDVSSAFTNYSYGLGADGVFDWKSSIGNYQVNGDLTYLIKGKSTIRTGAQLLWYDFSPAKINPIGDQSFPAFELNKENALESSAYLEHEYVPSKKVTLLYGIRFTHFMNLGTGDEYVYSTDPPVSRDNIIDTVDAKGDVLATYIGFEPRFGVKFALDSASSIKLGYNRTKQYIHLVSNTTNGLPIDVWKLSDQHVQPVVSDQVAVGYFRNFKNNAYEGSVEIYYKQMKDVLDYKNGADLLFNETLETELIPGLGRAYGLELFTKKKKGKLTGFVSYTVSRSERQAVGETRESTINNGEWYRASFDKLHDLKLVGFYEIKKRLSIGLNFIYATGRAMTYPDGKYEYQGITIPKYVGRNQARLPSYHRLDLSLTLDSKKNENRKWQSSWVFSIYNLYSRKNAYSINFTQDEDNPSVNTITRLSILGSIIPAATYNFEF